ncbi:MAG: hypothetical protein ACRDV6_06715, partial [Acidimicrobiales bacterium]
MSARRPEGFDPGAIIEAFNRNGVRYVVIGAFAAQLQGAPIPRTRDIDLTPSSDPVNLERLSAALDELGARIRIADDLDGLPFDHDATSLGRVQMWNLTSPHGDFDIAFTPSGTDG